MGTSDTTTDAAVEPDTDGKERVVAADIKVGKAGRMTIPESKRERYGIEQGDFIDIVLFVDGGQESDAQ